MVTAEDVLKKVTTLKNEYAEHALTRPSGNTSFDYGKAVGSYLTIAQMQRMIEEMFAEDARREKEEESKS